MPASIKNIRSSLKERFNKKGGNKIDADSSNDVVPCSADSIPLQKLWRKFPIYRYHAKVGFIIHAFAFILHCVCVRGNFLCGNYLWDWKELLLEGTIKIAPLSSSSSTTWNRSFWMLCF